MNSVIYFLDSSVNILLYLIYDMLSTCLSLYPPINVPSFSDAFQSTLCHSEDISLNVASWVPLPEILISEALEMRPGMCILSKICALGRGKQHIYIFFTFLSVTVFPSSLYLCPLSSRSLSPKSVPQCPSLLCMWVSPLPPSTESLEKQDGDGARVSVGSQKGHVLEIKQVVT